MLALTAGRAATALALLTVPLALSACTSEPEAVESSAEVVVESSSEAPAQEPTETAAETTAPASAGNDICDLITMEEAAAVIGDAYLAPTYVIGSLEDTYGGQCVWTNSPDGEIVFDVSSHLELVTWVPDGLNPAPADAPAVGTEGVVDAGVGTYFTTDSAILWLRVTGELASDPAATAAAKELSVAVDARN